MRVREVARVAKAKSDLNAMFSRKIEVEEYFKVVENANNRYGVRNNRERWAQRKNG